MKLETGNWRKNQQQISNKELEGLGGWLRGNDSPVCVLRTGRRVLGREPGRDSQQSKVKSQELRLLTEA
jgi:hypothetical protein